MIHQLFSIHDHKAKTFELPMPAPNKDLFIRQLVQMLEENPKHPYRRFYPDFSIHHVANFDTETGEILYVKAHAREQRTTMTQIVVDHIRVEPFSMTDLQLDPDPREDIH